GPFGRLQELRRCGLAVAGTLSPRLRRERHRRVAPQDARWHGQDLQHGEPRQHRRLEVGAGIVHRETAGLGKARALGVGAQLQKLVTIGNGELTEGGAAALVGDADQGRRGEGERRVARPEELGEARRGGRGRAGLLVHRAPGCFGGVSFAGGGGGGSRGRPSARRETMVSPAIRSTSACAVVSFCDVVSAFLYARASLKTSLGTSRASESARMVCRVETACGRAESPQANTCCSLRRSIARWIVSAVGRQAAPVDSPWHRAFTLRTSRRASDIAMPGPTSVR